MDGDIELLQELNGIFVVEYPKLLTQLRAAMTEGSGDAIGKAAQNS